MEDVVDRLLRCSECGSSFVFTSRDQVFYLSRQFADPRRCPDCRKSRRHQQQECVVVYHAPDAELPGTRSALPRPRSKTPVVVSREVLQELRREKVTYEAVCSHCHQVAQLPFRPAEGRPVLCRRCFRSAGSEAATPCTAG